MKYCSLVVFTLALAGCASNPPSTSTVFEYTQQPSATFSLANVKPLAFSGDTAPEQRARLVFGYPLVKEIPMGRFTEEAMLKSTPEQVEMYKGLGHELKLNPKFNTFDGLSIGAGVGGAAGGAIALVSLLGSTPDMLDPRQRGSAAVCFIAEADAASPQEAMDKCGAIVLQNFTSALFGAVQENFEAGMVASGAPADGDTDKHHRTYLASLKKRGYYAKGYAPESMGGYPAHIAFVRVRSLPAYGTRGPKIEEVVELVAKTKPANVVYMFSAMEDGHKKRFLEPIGIF